MKVANGLNSKTAKRNNIMLAKKEIGYLLPRLYNFLAFYTFYKFISGTLIFIFIVICGVQTYMYIRYLSVEVFFRYTVFHFLSYYGLAVNILYYTVMEAFFKKTAELYSSQLSFNIDHTTQGARNEIRRYSEKISAIWLLFVLTITFSSFAHLYHYHTHSSLDMFTLKVQKILFPAICKPIKAIGSLIILLQVVPSIAVPTQFLFLLFHGKVNIILLKTQIKNRNKICCKKCVANPEVIKAQLKLIVRNYLEIIAFHLEIMNSNRTEIVVYILTGLLTCFASFVSVLSPDFTTKFATMQFGTFLVYAFFTCHISQDYTDSGVMLTEIFRNMDWYNWNIECQKMYLIASGHFFKGLEVRIFLMFVVGNDLLKKICFTAYRVAGFLLSVRNNN